MELIWLIKICLKETHSRICIGKNLKQYLFKIARNKEVLYLSPLLFNFF